MKISSFFPFLKSSCLLVAVATLTACGSGSPGDTGSTNPAVKNKGTVGIVLTDKPADASTFAAINATIEAVELLGEDDDNRYDLGLTGESKTLDLLSLKSESVPFTVNSDVPVGHYCKIRLTLSDLELVIADETPDDMSDNETYHPKLPGNGKLDLVVRGCFDVSENEIITIQVDIDAGKSIHIVGNGKGYQFRPVVFVDVLDSDYKGKLIRVSGVVASVNETESMFQLCKVFPNENANSAICADIHTGDTTAFFDNETYNGEPRPLSELLANGMIDKSLTVVGWHRYFKPSSKTAHVPPGHYPAQGECRLWKIGVPPGLQKAPIQCDDVPKELPANTIVVNHQGVVKNTNHPFMKIDALAVELGAFSKLTGQVESDVENAEFALDVNHSTTTIVSEPVTTLIQETVNNVNGTRIVTNKGELLSSGDLAPNQGVQIDGIVETVNEQSQLSAALIIVDLEGAKNVQFSGTVDSVQADYFMASTVEMALCGQPAATQVRVDLTAETRVTTVVITDQDSSVQQFGTLDIDQQISVDGYCHEGDYLASDIVIIDDQRS